MFPRPLSTLALCLVLAGSACAQDILPRPASMKEGQGAYLLGERTRIHAGPGTREEAERLRNLLRPATGLLLPIEEGTGREGIRLVLDAKATGLGPEGYRLVSDSRGVEIRAHQAAGLFYGAQTLRQLLPVEILRQSRAAGITWSVPARTIEDAPRFAWRGSMVDTGRHFQPVSFLKKHLDLMALHKLNVFHWHLTEDQGWRLEIRKYPKLTGIGAWRRETMAAPFPGRMEHLKGDDTPHGGFYTQDQVREIVQYAAERHITVVPEIELPGHATAAIVAYPELGNGIRPPMEVPSHFGVHRTVYNTEDRTLAFLKDVLSEVLELFPSKYIHIGGDECPKDEWKQSPQAQARMQALGLKDEHQLWSWFIQQMATFLHSKGRTLVGWDEIHEGGLAGGAVVMSWQGEKGGIDAAKAGHDVVMAPNSHTYLDHYQSRSTAEPFAIGGFLPLEKVYSYDPANPEIPADKLKHVLGAQAQLWTEYMPTPQHVEYMAWPRLTALAEVVWSPREGKDFADFQKRLKTQAKRFEVLGVNARPEGGNPGWQLRRP